jgi:hypothetical protein
MGLRPVKSAMAWRQVIAEIIEAPKIITSRPDIGYWIDSSRIGVKPCANELKG